MVDETGERTRCSKTATGNNLRNEKAPHHNLPTAIKIGQHLEK